MNAEESYNALAEHVGYAGSERLRAVLENLLTPDQARIVAALPGTAQDVAKKTKKMKAVIDPEKCWGCGVCVVGCDKVNALAMKVVRPPEHIPDPPPRN
jgi:NAD-dependent dihydropyrimidine dehydrogenase PreA subunit